MDVRTGLLAHFDSGKGTEFMLQLGIPSHTVSDEFSLDNLYVLFEPRMRFEHFSMFVTFFYHPLVYMHQKEEAERGRADVNLKLLFGGGQESLFFWGMDTTLGINVHGTDSLSLNLGPFLGFRRNGLEWFFKFRLDPLAKNKEDIFDMFMGIKTAF